MLYDKVSSRSPLCTMNMVVLIVIILLALGRASVGVGTPELSHYLPFFHTTVSIHDSLVNIQKNCVLNMTIDNYPVFPNGGTEDEAFIDVVTLTPNLKQRDSMTTPPRRALFVFGEHARELITVESGYAFLSRLCNPNLVNLARVRRSCTELPENFVIKLVLNANPVSRQRVENGEFCLRTNGNGTDLNRNWDAGWVKETGFGPETYPDNEQESRMVRDVLYTFHPDIYATIHSGSCAYIGPNSLSGLPPNKKPVRDWQNVVARLQHHGPNCPCGPAMDVIGYKATGTSMDYAFDILRVPLSFGFEVYHPGIHLLFPSSPSPTPPESNSNKPRNLRRLRSLPQDAQDSGPQTTNTKITERSVSEEDKLFMERLIKDANEAREMLHFPNATANDIKNFYCLYALNPLTESRYTQTLSVWNDNYLCLLTPP